MYLYCIFPVDEDFRPGDVETVALVRAKLEPFGGVAAKLCDEIREPGQINYTKFETMLAPDPWYRGRAIVVGDAAHCTTPHLAAGAAMCLEDAVALGEELSAAPTIDDALRAFCKRRFDRIQARGRDRSPAQLLADPSRDPRCRSPAGHRRGLRAPGRDHSEARATRVLSRRGGANGVVRRLD